MIKRLCNDIFKTFFAQKRVPDLKKCLNKLFLSLT